MSPQKAEGVGQWLSQNSIVGSGMANVVARAYMGSGAGLQPQNAIFVIFTVALWLRSAIQSEFSMNNIRVL